MIQNPILLRIIMALMFMVLVAACGSYMHQPMRTKRAIIGPETPTKKALLNLPEAKEKIVVAVYKFRDQTGQYKASETGANWSTAVTQGATTILIRALEESGWFIPIERENMGNLLNERKIIRTSRAQYEGGDENSNSLLPPLMFAGVILEGGIISYETNIRTGGAGIRYFGADASGQYREDRVSIYIRAVLSSNGKILKTVYTTKSILSQEVSVGLFRYVKTKRLLEAETGFTYNEPSEICVIEAIEKAVESLIIEGIKGRLWSLKNPQDTTSFSFVNYFNDKKTSYLADPMGRIVEKNNRGILALGISGGSNSYMGDYAGRAIRPKTSFQLGLALNHHLYLDSEIGYRGLMVKKRKLDDYSMFGDLSLRYIFLPYEKLTPYLSAGGGFDFNKKGVGLSHEHYLPKANASLGMEYMAGKKVSFMLSSDWNYYLSDRFDGARSSHYNDFSWGISLGMKVYIFNLRQKGAF